METQRVVEILIRTLFLFIIFTGLSTTYAIKCYTCNSYKLKSCDSESLDGFVTECPKNAVGCRKMTSHIHSHGEMTRRVIRQCARSSDGFDCETIFGTNGKNYWSVYCECKGDLCNSSPPIKPSTALMHTLVLLVIIHYLRMNRMF